MKKLLIWTVLLLTAPLSTYAQNKIVTVSGRVIEAGTKEPVELAAVQLLSLPDSTQVVEWIYFKRKQRLELFRLLAKNDYT